MTLIKLIILLSFSVVLFGCGGNSTSSNTANSNAANSLHANSASTDPSNSNGSDTNTADPANANIQNSAPPKRAVKAKPEETPMTAPDDSEITSENNAQGELIETRIFKNHDMVAKVERTQNASKKDASIKVYLKNGKVYEVPAGKIKDILKESPEEIIKAVGGDVVVAASQAANKAQTDTKSGAGAANTSAANTAPTPERR